MRTAEFVTPKHPDKLCDQISDAILDAHLGEDPFSRVAVEAMGGHGIITVTGEITSNAEVNIADVVKSVVGDGYGIQVNVVAQSKDIEHSVDGGGAGDQGIMIGYACKETPEFLPLEYVLARDLARYLYDFWQVDGKTQVSVQDGAPVTVVASFQGVANRTLTQAVKRFFRVEEKGFDMPELIIGNPDGSAPWKVGGFDADTGVTGRKIVVDAYGPRVPVGGGAFSGKDPSKVDRSGAYMARYQAIRLLKANDAKEVVFRLAYAFGRIKPLDSEGIIVEGNSDVKAELLDLRPESIIDKFDLRRPIYRKTAEWGHFGNGFPWDK